MLRIVSKALLLCFCLSGARERMNPFKPLTVLVPLPDSEKMMVHISWNHSSDGNWKLRYHMSMGDHGRPVPLSGRQLREFTARLERDFEVPRLLDPVSFNMKKRKWRKGWVQSGRCGSLEPYWDKSSKNLSMAIWDAYSVLEASDLPKTKVLVNVGAGDGPGAGQSVDPVWVLALGFQLDAVFVEPGQRDFEKLKQNIESHRMPLGLGSEPYQMVLKPDDIPKLVRGSAVLQQNLHWLDVLKVDIDVNDCDVAASFLRERRARIVVIEVNPSFPPPIHFCQHATSPPHGNTKPLHGCSLSYMVELFATFDLWLYRFDGQDGLFVDSFLAREITEAFGERFPKDEIDCFQWPQLLPSTASAPVDDFRNWFYDIAKAEEMLDVALRTAKAQYARERRLCPVGPEAQCKFHDIAATGERAMVRAPPYKWLDAGSQVACKQACCDDTYCRAATFSGSGGHTCMLHKQVPLLNRSALPESGADAIDVVHVRREARDEEACMEAFQVLQPHLPMTIGLPICGPSCQFPVWP